MVTSSTTIDTDLPAGSVVHDGMTTELTSRASLSAESPPPTTTASPVVDSSIDEQLARTFRWRRLPWHEQVKARQRAKHRSASKQVAEQGQGSTFDIAAQLSEQEPAEKVSWLFTRCSLVSAGVHASIFAILATLTYAMTVEDRWALRVLPLTPGEQQIDIVSPEMQFQASLQGTASSGVSIVTRGVSLPDADAMVGAMQPDAGAHTHVAGKSRLVGETLAMLGDEGTGLTQDEAAEPGAEFFGVKAAGTKFVFVVDCSMSMQGPKWLQARQQLLQAVQHLGSEQYFYVIFFDRDSHLMFDPQEAEAELLPATEQNILRLRQWINSFRLGYDTEPFYSVRQALAFWPDAIYLLSDGEFSDPTAAYLRRNNFKHVDGELRMPAVAVHTIGLHNPGGRKLLQRIARENRGTHRFVTGAE